MERIDGWRCAIIDGHLYKYHNARKRIGGRVRAGSRKADCYGGWWMPVERNNPEDRWIVAAYFNTPWIKGDGEYVAVGPHFNGNPYGLDEDFLDSAYRIRVRDIPRTLDGIAQWLREHEVAGVVFRHGEGEPCYVDRRDLGLPWPLWRWRCAPPAGGKSAAERSVHPPRQGGFRCHGPCSGRGAGTSC